jgi:VanZ family protein
MKSGSNRRNGGDSEFISGGEINPGSKVCQTSPGDYTPALRSSDLLKSWLPVALWMAFIFVGSTDLMSAEHTSRFVTPFLRWLKPDISLATIEQIHFLIRKTAHLIEYAILAVLLLRAFREKGANFPRRAAVVFVVAVLFALTDEYHQSSVTSRTSSLGDVAIDSVGAFLGIVIYRTRHSPLLLRDNKAA